MNEPVKINLSPTGAPTETARDMPGNRELPQATTPTGGYRLQTFKSGAAHLSNTRRVKAWVKERFCLADDETIMVNEVACELPGCPPIETIIAYWTSDGTRHHYKIFKPVAEVVEVDLPPRWMKDALAVSDDFYCWCC